MMRISILFAPAILLSFLVVSIVPELGFAQPDENWFTNSLFTFTPDCSTAGPNPPPDYGGDMSGGPDPTLVDPVWGPCDSYQYDALERPTNQAQDSYLPAADIDTTWLGLDADYIYVGIGLHGFEGSVPNEAPYWYGAEFDVDGDSVGDFFFQWNPGVIDDTDSGTPGTTFSGNADSLNWEVWNDLDGSLGTTAALKFTPEGPASNNGYEEEWWKSGNTELGDETPLNGAACHGRVVTRPVTGLDTSGNPSGSRIRVDLACLRLAVGNIAAIGDMFRSWADKGNAGGGNRYFHDVRDATQYGGPYPNTVSGNTYEIDNNPGLCRLAEGEECQSVLPVELIKFGAVVSNRRIELTWSTASETNNAGFEVQQSSNGDPFVPIDFVPGHGTTSDAHDYQFVVDYADVGLHRFRLKQIDFDGAFEYGPIIEVAVVIPGGFVLEPAYPNPFNPSTNIRFAVAREQRISVEMYDVLGKRIRSLFDGQANSNEVQTIRINADGLPSGTYLIKLSGEGIAASRSVILQR